MNFYQWTFTSELVLPCRFPTTLKWLFSWIYPAERSLERWVRASGMAASVFGEHLEINYISILTERLNNSTETQLTAAVTDLSERCLCTIVSHSLPTSFLYFFFFLIFWTLRCSYLTVSVPQKWSRAAAEVAKADEWNLSCNLTGNSYITLFYYATCSQFDLLQDVHVWLLSLRLQKKRKHHKENKNQVKLRPSKPTFVQEIVCLSALFKSLTVAAGSDTVQSDF